MWNEKKNCKFSLLVVSSLAQKYTWSSLCGVRWNYTSYCPTQNKSAVCVLVANGWQSVVGGNGKQRKKNFISSSFHFLPTKSMCWEVRAKIFRGRKKKKFFFRESGSKWWKNCFASISGGWVAKVQPTEVPLDRALITRPPKTGWKINVLTFWKIFAHRTPQNPLNSAIQLCPLCPWPGPHNNSLPDWDESTTPR